MLKFIKQKIKIKKIISTHPFFFKGLFWGVTFFVCIYVVSSIGLFSTKYDSQIANADISVKAVIKAPIFTPITLDSIAYNKKLIEIANNPIPVVKKIIEKTSVKTSKNSKISTQVIPITPTTPAPVAVPKPKTYLWPAKTVEPNVGALLPFNRIVAYYGNFYSKKMGVLGEFSTDIMLAKLNSEVEAWKLADPATPVIPAIHYIAITAQGSPGADGKYRLRMPFDQIDHAIELAKKINGIVFLDLQVGLSNVQTEIPLLEKYLKMPQVHLGLDPEFSMKTGVRPGKVIGTMDATDINFAANYLAKLVKENNLTPKILIVHRFTNKMLTNYKQITPLPEVQIVVDMDGWGYGAKKISTYQQVVYKEPVQFTGFKLFYKNDLLPPSTRMLTPKDILGLTPQPMYIQYQ